MTKNTEKLATIVLADIPDNDSIWKKWLGLYKFRFYISMVFMFNSLKPGGNMMLFFNPEYKSWIVDVLKKFEVMKYRWIIYKKGKLGVKDLNRYDFCYRLYKKPSVMDKRKPREYEISSSEGNDFIESLILYYSELGDVVYDCFDLPNEIQSLCEKNARDYTTMND